MNDFNDHFKDCLNTHTLNFELIIFVAMTIMLFRFSKILILYIYYIVNKMISLNKNFEQLDKIFFELKK